MKLRTRILTLAAPLALGAALAACNDIKDGDRFIELPAVEAQRVVLLEEFTGQNCVNCPDAHVVVEQLCEQYPDNLIAVSIHGGPLSISISKDPRGLANDESNAYFEANGRPDLPAGVVNRASGVTKSDTWANAIRNMLAQPSTIEIEVDAVHNAQANAIDIITSINPHQNLAGRLQIWIVEDGVVRKQSFPGNKTNNRYEHNHVFRAAVNGIEGQPVTLVTREPVQLASSIAVSEDWDDLDNISVVAFVYNEAGVAQAAKCHLKKQ